MGGSTRNATPAPTGLLNSVPVGASALAQALEISQVAVDAGFEWSTVDDVWVKVEEEMAELKEAYASGSLVNTELELGDVLFSLVNVARKMGVNAEDGLNASCTKFRMRWAHMEAAAQAQGTCVEQLDFNEMQALWDAAKLAE